jgi:diguanylate cyclase (GGDEF)-like protein
MSDGGATFADRALAAVLDLSGEGALLFEGEGLACHAASARGAEVLGLARDALAGKTRDELLAGLVPGDEATARALAALRGVAPAETRRETLAIKGDPPRVLSWATAPILADGEPSGRVDLFADHTVEALLREDLERAYLKMASTSVVDELTGLANRKHFEHEMDREHRRSQRAWASYAIARIDVDGMANLNADLGRDGGDRLLRQISQTIKEARREYDLVARWENDELAVLLPAIDERSVKVVLARSLAAMRDAARAVAGREVTFCVGVALWIPPSIESAADIVQRAGLALRASKIMGAGHVEIDARMVEWKDDPSGA